MTTTARSKSATTATTKRTTSSKSPTPNKNVSRETSAADDGTRMPTQAVLRRLKLSPEVAWYLISRGIELPRHAPLFKTPEPRNVRGAAFDGDAVDKVMRAFQALRHTQGRLAGQPLRPDPWQVAYIIAPVFGWVRRDDTGRWVRIIRNLFIEVPRKNGKTTTAGGIALYLTGGDSESGAQVIVAATTKDQAGFLFTPVKNLAESAPALKKKFRPVGTKILHPRSGSYMQVVSNIADAQHGANIHGAVVDELHLHKTRDLIEAIETGTGSRDQPLVATLTTADAGKTNTIYAERRKLIESLSKGVLKDHTQYGIVFAATEKMDPFAEETVRIANPGYPISPTRSYIESKIAAARNSPIELASYQRLHLGIRTKQVTRYIELTDWDRNGFGTLPPESDFAGRECYGGLDLSSVSDLTSLCWLFPGHGDPETGNGYAALFRTWAPEARLHDLDKRTAGAASTWVDQGFLTLTPGDVIDYDFVQAQITRDMDAFEVQSLGFDPWNSTQLSIDLLDQGVPMVKVRQGFATLSPPMKELQRLMKTGKRATPTIRHGGNPLTRWAVDNLAVAQDAAGNVKPDKANSGDKIDPVAALVIALSEAMTGQAGPKSGYSGGRDVVFL